MVKTLLHFIKRNYKYSFFITFALILQIQSIAVAQQAIIEVPYTAIGQNQAFQIKATLKNENLREYSHFPEIPGFQKGGTSSSSSTQIINGRMSMAQSIVQTYIPTKQGTFKISPFRIQLNKSIAEYKGGTVTVGPPVQAQRRRSRSPFDAFDPFEDFFGGGRQQQQQEFVEIQDDAFFAISVDKDEVYLGEGFVMTVAFYASLKNKAPLDFYEVGEQLADIMKKVRPKNCWEENFGIKQIEPVYVHINGQQYKQFKLYEGVLFPLNTNTIEIPATALKMIKYKVAKNPTFFGRNSQQDFKTYYSMPKTVKVKELPDHPLKDVVNVGNFRLKEKIGESQAQTGNSVEYSFEIVGAGNISGLHKPTLPAESEFSFYPPNVVQNINRSNGRVYGSKAFSYFIEPNEPGEFDLGNYFQWVYFNPETEQYDTLKANAQLSVTGESKKNASIAANDLGGFYDRIEAESNIPVKIGQSNMTRYLIGSVAFLLLLGTVYIVSPLSRRKERE